MSGKIARALSSRRRSGRGAVSTQRRVKAVSAPAPDSVALARRIYDRSHLTGEFTLRSGATSEEYLDKYLFESDPELLREIALGVVPEHVVHPDLLGGWWLSKPQHQGGTG